ncbi:MAG: hypothetical protein KC466_02705, partial [Myxococcales bacterium]|nr:hypothetical protein [Myxococcales bacterium]
MLRSLFLENLSLKLLSLLLALTIYLFVNYETTTEIGVPVPVELIGIPPNFTLIGQPPSTAHVRIEGPKTRLDSINRESLKFVVDLASAQEGLSTFKLSEEQLRLPQGCEVRSISPSAITVSLELTEKRKFPVYPHFEGEPPDDVVIGSIRVSPATIQISGPLSALDSIEFVRTTRISLRGRRESFVAKVGIDATGQPVAPTSNDPIQVFIEFLSRKERGTLPAIPVETRGQLPYPIRIEPPAIDVTLEGPPMAVRTLVRNRQLSAYVDIEGLEAGEYDRPIEFSFQGDQIIARSTPETVRVVLVGPGAPAPEAAAPAP